jgi:divalent metal cation (Fe/Co/Zn/Cd) transporter
MCGIGLIASKKNLNQLLDRVPESEFFDLVRKAALKVVGVRDTEKIRIQHYGPDAHVDIDVEVDPHLTVEEAHTISQHVRSSIQHDWPNVQDVTVHIEPYYEGDH